MKNKREVIAAGVGMLAMLPYFPSEAKAREGIMILIDHMTANAEQVEWLVTAMITRMGSWTGPVEMRALFCTRYPPEDGIEENFPQGHKISVENERRAIERSDEHKQLLAGSGVRLLEAGIDSEKKSLTAAEQAYQERRHKQNQRWAAICRQRPLIPKQCKREAALFATTDDLDERERILNRLMPAREKLVAR